MDTLLSLFRVFGGIFLRWISVNLWYNIGSKRNTEGKNMILINKNKLLLSLVACSVMTSNSWGIMSIDVAKQYLDAYTSTYNIYVKGIQTYTNSYNNYKILYEKTSNITLKNAYKKSMDNALMMVNMYTVNAAKYKTSMDNAQKDYDAALAYYTPKPTYTPSVGDFSHIINTSTLEYTNSKVNSLVGVDAAYSQGYTGKGVTVAVIDSGTSFRNSDITSKVSFTTQVWDKSATYSNMGVLMNTEVINGTQIDMISYTKPTYKFTTPPEVELIGSGTGASAVAVLNTDGTLKGIYITNHGSGYDINTQVKITDPITHQSYNISQSAVLGGQDLIGHGSMTSSLIAGAYDGNNIAGIAYDSTLLVAKAGNSIISSVDVKDAVQWAVTNKASVINQSFSAINQTSIFPDLNSQYINAVKNNVSFVTAAGNDGLSCTTTQSCNIYALAPLLPGNESIQIAQGAWIVAGALNDTGTDIASYSNRAGLTKNYYILAPGTNVMADSLNNSLKTASGTSFAAPIVTGSMALLKQKWPQLNGQQQAQILFQTADDMGAPGVDDIYGWGKLNLTKAFSPIGDLKVPSIMGNTQNIYKTTSVSGSVVASAIASISMLNDTIGLDTFQRDFKLNLTQKATTTLPIFSFDQFNSMPIGNFSIGINNLYDAVMVGYNKNNCSVKVSYLNNVMGSEGQGLLSFNGHTYYGNVGYDIGKRYEGFNVHVDTTIGYSNVNSNSSIMYMSDITTLGVNTKLTNNGFGIMANIPGKIVSGSMDISTPTSLDMNGNVVFSHNNVDMSKGAFESNVGFIYENNNINIQLVHTNNQYNISGIDSNNLKVNGIWYW